MTEPALPPAPDEYAGAEDIVVYALKRVEIEVARTREWVEECREQLATAELMHHEAVTAELALARLVEGGELYRDEPAPDAEAYESTEAFYWEEIEWPAAIEPEPASVAAIEPPPEPAAPAANAAQFAPAPVQSEPQRRPGRAYQPATGPLGDGRTLREIQKEGVLAALRRLADAEGYVRRSLAELGRQSDVPHGSMSPVLHDLADSGVITIRKNTLPGSRTPAPNTYHLVDWKAPPAPDDPTMIPGGPEPSPEIEAAVCAAAFFPPDDEPPKPVGLIPAPCAPRIAEIRIEPRSAPTRAPTNVSRQLLGEPRCGAPAPVAEPVEESDAPILVAEHDCGAGPRRLAALRFGQCKWPLDDPGAGQMDQTLFCAKPSGERIYCTDHAARALA